MWNAAEKYIFMIKLGFPYFLQYSTVFPKVNYYWSGIPVIRIKRIRTCRDRKSVV